MRAVLTLLIAFCIFPAAADDAAMQRFIQLNSDPALRQQAQAAGEQRISFCGHCHGRDGNSKREHIPNLAGQNPLYLFNAFEKFANGERKDFVMSKLAPSLILEDRVNVAIYYSAQQVVNRTEELDPALVAQGQALFQSTCSGCHGSAAQGLESMPRLAGQPAEYLRLTLRGFRDKSADRAGSLMVPIAANLSDQQIDALAAYLQQLKF
jgi:cytochrome c553